jgi:hypothetical protein
VKPLCIDLYCGLGGWTEGFLAEGYEIVGFDIERHDYGPQVSKNDDGSYHIRPGGYPAQLVLKDVLTLHGSQFRDAACIVASPPCQKYSYMAMPWSRAKAMAAEIRQDAAKIEELNRLFNVCFRLQLEASQAAGRHIPMVVENVKGAQPWVGRAAWHYGSFYLWGDVPALMPPLKFVKLPGNDTFKANGLPCNKFTDPRYGSGVKQHGSGAEWSDKALDEQRKAAGVKVGADAFSVGFKNSAAKLVDAAGLEGFNVTPEERKVQHMSRARKAASAQIAKIPFELASYVARIYHPGSELQAVG